MSVIAGILVLLLLPVAYAVPALIAYARGHDERRAIAIVNVTLGWTIVGWLITLVWALTRVKPKGSVPPIWRRRRQA
ncbi:MAG TPA: superinfection immunity protein [bacterium]|nr:superinfection immunity protein [bacterium]